MLLANSSSGRQPNGVLELWGRQAYASAGYARHYHSVWAKCAGLHFVKLLQPDSPECLDNRTRGPPAVRHYQACGNLTAVPREVKAALYQIASGS